MFICSYRLLLVSYLIIIDTGKNIESHALIEFLQCSEDLELKQIYHLK